MPSQSEFAFLIPLPIHAAKSSRVSRTRIPFESTSRFLSFASRISRLTQIFSIEFAKLGRLPGVGFGRGHWRMRADSRDSGSPLRCVRNDGGSYVRITRTATSGTRGRAASARARGQIVLRTSAHRAKADAPDISAGTFFESQSFSSQAASCAFAIRSGCSGEPGPSVQAPASSSKTGIANLNRVRSGP